jgi:hypothetical protein
MLAQANTAEWIGLEFWRYGTDPDQGKNPVTVIVKVLKTSPSPLSLLLDTFMVSLHGSRNHTMASVDIQ